MRISLAETVFPDAQARGGLPVWSYDSEEFHELEKEHVFTRNWFIVGHVSEIPERGDYLTLNVADERALVVRGGDGQVRAFHNHCRHRGSRVLAEARGNCGANIVCPFHGWCYGLDGRLRGAPQLQSFGDAVDRRTMGLKPLEFEIWHGLIFVRFKPSSKPSVAETMAPFAAELASYRLAEMKPYGEPWAAEQAVNWKSAVDVDMEGYHVPKAHPSLNELYGPSYTDEVVGDVVTSSGLFSDRPASLWSVRHYLQLLPENADLPEKRRRGWFYYGLFPSVVLTFYPDMVDFYQTLPLGVDRCVMAGRSFAHPDRRREMRAARYLNGRINRVTGDEDVQLVKWSYEGMRSIAFDDIVLSDLEVGVRLFHDDLRAALPVLDLDDCPTPGTMEALNNERLNAA